MRGFIMFAAALALGGTAAPLAAQPEVPPLATRAPFRADAAYLAGWWSDREDCRDAIEFRRDGQFFNPNGSRGTWRFQGDMLSLIGTQTVTVRLVPRSRDEAVVVQANRTLGYSRRCPAPPGRR